MTIRPRSEWGKNLGEKWKSCYFCDQKWYSATLHFDAGNSEIQEDETLTGATSGDTGVVDKVTVTSGTWAGGDAAGYVDLVTPTGADTDTGDIFEDDELINGSVSGAGAVTANGDGIYQTNGILYPKKDMIFYRGLWVCRCHFEWYWQRKFWDVENQIDVAELEKDRGTE